jgi:hypothetical protein
VEAVDIPNMATGWELGTLKIRYLQFVTSHTITMDLRLGEGREAKSYTSNSCGSEYEW